VPGSLLAMQNKINIKVAGYAIPQFDYRVSRIIVTQTWRPERLTVNRPGRQAGKRFVAEMSAEDAAHTAVPHLRRSSETPQLSRPDGRAYSLPVLRT
jgi:hypothetical protein